MLISFGIESFEYFGDWFARADGEDRMFRGGEKKRSRVDKGVGVLKYVFEEDGGKG